MQSEQTNSFLLDKFFRNIWAKPHCSYNWDSWTNRFRCKDLESLYLEYSHHQRRLGLILVLSTDVLLQVPQIIHSYYDSLTLKESLSNFYLSLALPLLTLTVVVLLCFKGLILDKYLHWITFVTWLILSTESVVDIWDLNGKTDLLWYSVWYCLTMVFSLYTMLPLPVLWSIFLGCLSTIIHIIIVTLKLFKPIDDDDGTDNEACKNRRIIAHILFFITINLSGIHIQYLTDKSQRRAFMEIFRFLQIRIKTQKENDKQENLLFSILPDFVAKDMIRDIETEQRRGSSLPRQFHKIYVHRYEEISILFADIKGFTALAAKCSAQELVKNLNNLFGRFDQLSLANHCLRIKLLGDCYYCVSGLPTPQPDHARCCVEMGLHMIKAIQEIKYGTHVDLNMRIGIHSGSILCGVLGLRKWQFDIWSHDVILANHMESSGVPGRVHISECTYKYVKGLYEIEQTKVRHKDLFLRKNNIKTYLIKQTEPQTVISVDILQKFGFPEHVTIEWISETPFQNLRESLLEEENDNAVSCFNIKGKYKLAKAESNMETFSIMSPFNDNVTTEIEKTLKFQYSFLNRLSLTYKNKSMEQQYNRIKRDTFKSNIFCYFIIWLLLLVFQVTIIKMDSIMMITLPIITLILALETLFVVVQDFKQFPKFFKPLSKVFNCNRKRKSFVIGEIIVIMACTSSLSLIDYSKHFDYCKNNTTDNITSLEKCLSTHTSSPSCYHPEYVIFPWVICIVAVVAALRMQFLIKCCITLVMLITYSVISWNYKELFIEYNDSILEIRIAILIVACFLMVVYHGRMTEVTARVHFLWKGKAQKELNDMEATKQINTLLLKNILPDHVARHFLSKEYNEQELYSQSKDGVGVLFASIPNFSEYYTEEHGLEYIRLLNEIIAHFDELLDEECFASIEKIKTISATATYMAVSGLNPSQKDPLKCEIYSHLSDLTQFALSLRQKLEEINQDSFSRFNLRIGISYGSLVCGVIGAKKPIFDVWGDTVNEASRMDSTGLSGLIQVSRNTAQLLVAQGFEVKKRGMVKVKGKGLMETYFVIGKKLKKVRSCQNHIRHYNSLGSIVHAIAQNKRKFISHSYKV